MNFYDKVEYTLEDIYSLIENEVEEMLGGNSTAEYKIFDVLLMDVPQLASLQYRVTYIAEQPNFPQTAYYAHTLSCLRDKARHGEEIKIILKGILFLYVKIKVRV